MTRREHFRSLPWYAQAVVIVVTPFAFAWIVIRNFGTLIQSVAEFWV